jgi:hypothetical protein
MPPHARAAIDAPADQYRSGPAKLGRHGSEPRKTRGYRRSESARSKLWAEHQPDQSREDTHIQGDSTSSGAHRLHPLPSASVIAALEGAEAKSHTTTIWTGSPAPLRRRRSPRHAESQKVRSPQGPSHFAWVPRCSGMSLEAAPGPGSRQEQRRRRRQLRGAVASWRLRRVNGQLVRVIARCVVIVPRCRPGGKHEEQSRRLQRPNEMRLARLEHDERALRAGCGVHSTRACDAPA